MESTSYCIFYCLQYNLTVPPLFSPFHVCHTDFMVKFVQPSRHFCSTRKRNSNQPEIMQVIFTKWHMITLDVVPFLINIFLQKRNYCAVIFTLQSFDTSTLLVISLAFQDSKPCHYATSFGVYSVDVPAETNVAVVSLHDVIFRCH